MREEPGGIDWYFDPYLACYLGVFCVCVHSIPVHVTNIQAFIMSEAVRGIHSAFKCAKNFQLRT